MEELISPLHGIMPLWVIVCLETLIVIIAMSVDFAAGYYKAKLRGEDRNSLGLKRTVSKFILYVGSIMIASGVDSIFYMCGFWGIIHFNALSNVPVVTTIISVFICVVEIRSVWEKADSKQRNEAVRTAEMIVHFINKDNTFKEAVMELLKSPQQKDNISNEIQ